MNRRPWRMNPRLWLISPITWVLERALALCRNLSLASLLFGSRERTQAVFSTSTSVVVLTIRRSRRIEYYILAWLVLELLAILSPIRWPTYTWLISIVFGYRIFDIIQTAINVNLFTALRRRAKVHRVASLVRIVVLAIWNFVELALCFGVVYFASRCQFKPILVTQLDALYFSAITQLTIGYGDFSPLGSMRFVVVAQGFSGFLLALFAVSRLIAFLPPADPIFRDDRSR